METIELEYDRKGVMKVRYHHRKYGVKEFKQLVSNNGVQGHVSFIAKSTEDYRNLSTIANEFDKIIIEKSGVRKR